LHSSTYKRGRPACRFPPGLETPGHCTMASRFTGRNRFARYSDVVKQSCARAAIANQFKVININEVLCVPINLQAQWVRAWPVLLSASHLMLTVVSRAVQLRLLYRFDRRFTRCDMWQVDSASSWVHRPMWPVTEIFWFIYYIPST